MSATLSEPQIQGSRAPARGTRAAAAPAWSLMALYAASRFLQIYPGRTPLVAVVALHVLPPLAFALVHGARAYGRRGILVFFAISLVAGNLVENLGVRTGFPFGHYSFTDAMGPKIAAVPVFLGLAYVGMAYLSWTLAGVMLGGSRRAPGWRLLTVPVVAAAVMTSWDLAQDPVWSTLLHLWIWVRGGAYFGVPVSNFLGWYLVMYLIYQLFALYLWRRGARPQPQSAGHWRQAVAFYGLSAAGNLLPLLGTGSAMVADPAGALWRVGDITAAAALVSLFAMGTFTLVAWVRAGDGT